MSSGITAQRSGPRRAIIIFDSRYGHTERIAKSFETGLKQAGVEAICINSKESQNLESLKEFDLIAVGAPTEKITASESIKEFLDRIDGVDLRGRSGFAFDTKLSYPLSGSAAKYIEKKLKNVGLEMIMPRSNSIVIPLKEAKEEGGVKLKEGEEKRFEEIGFEVGKVLASKGKEVIPA